MASTKRSHRASRHAVSYRESSASNDSDPSSDEAPLSSRRSRATNPASSNAAVRARMTRPEVSYRELSSSDTSEDDLVLSSTNASPVFRERELVSSRSEASRRSTRVQERGSSRNAASQRRRRSGEGVEATETSRPSQPKRPRLSSKTDPRRHRSSGPKTHRLVRKPKVDGKAGIPHRVRPEADVPSDGVRPLWQTLPYEILLRIFQYASNPLHDEHFKPSPSVNWLLDVARICRSFADPALTALYESPPLHYRDQPHGLLDLLEANSGYVNYRMKIKKLELDSRRTLAYSHAGRGQFDIAALVALLPQLSAVHISNPIDRPPYRQMTQKRGWSYPEALFAALNTGAARLRSWHWSGASVGKAFPGFGLLHSEPPFQTLEHLSLSHLEFASESEPPHPRKTVMFGSALTSLPCLRRLSLESCPRGYEEVLNNLPNDLFELSITNCSSFDATVLHPFLVEHGQTIRVLVLNHNHSLDLSWLPDLKTCCPNLQVLRMDQSFFSSAILTNNSDFQPQYECLLLPGDVPTWPSTLQELEMLNLRKWSSEAAVTFFTSLIDSAYELPYLRHLTVKAMLDIGWRDRAGFRDKWIARMRKVFCSRSDPPNPHLASFKTYRLWQEANSGVTKRQNEIRQAKMKQTEMERSMRSLEDEGDGISAIQGMCETVNINIDNLRPLEMQYNEGHFMDEEASGDEEWTGIDREEPRSVAYAW